MNTHRLTIATSLCAVALAAVVSADGVSTREIHRLGGSTALYGPPLTTAASLQRMARDATMVDTLRTVFAQAGLPDLADGVVAAMAAASTSVSGAACGDAAPADGVLVECDVQPGQTLQWMAYRPGGRTKVGLLRDVRWAGKRPFSAYLFRVTRDNRTFTFVVPKVCGNLSLMDVRDRPREPAAAATPPPPPPPPPSPPPPPPAPPSFPLEPVAPPPPQVRVPPFLFDVMFGKERRVRTVEDTDLEFAQCSPLLGLRFGLATRYRNDWEVAGALGIAFNLVSGDGRVREHELFADVEANRYLAGGAFVGSGLSLWDLTRGDTFTPAWMLHVGWPITKSAAHPVYLMAQGRWFLDHADDIRNNYQFWGGVRARF